MTICSFGKILILCCAFCGLEVDAQDAILLSESPDLTQSPSSPVSSAKPPVAEKRSHSYTHHGITIEDPYFWLKDQSYPKVEDEDVLDYVKAENAWFEAKMEPQKPLVDRLFKEMRARIKEEDSSVPQKDGDWFYWSEFEEGGEYRKYYRKPVAGGEGQLILDGPTLAEGKEYFSLGALSVSENGRFMAYSVDDTGAERYTARIVDLDTGAMLSDVIPDVQTGLIWAANDTMLVYGPSNESWRVDNVRVHKIGTDASEDKEIYREADEGFQVGPGVSNNRQWLIIGVGDHETSEVYLLPLADPFAEPVLVRARKKGVEYDVDLHGETVFIITNDVHVNFRLATASLSKPGEWTTLIEGSDEFYLTGVDLYRDYYAIEGRLAGLDQIQIRYYDDPSRIEPITFPESTYSAGFGGSPEWVPDTLRVGYESMVTPNTVYDYDVTTRKLDVLKVQEIPSGFDPSLYKVERLQVEARDGTQIPVSIVYRKDRPMGASGQGGPLHLYSYGAYGNAIAPGFSTTRFSLVDRGMAYAIAHIRGGDDLGRKWYLAGKLLERTNTFNDFVDVAKGMVDLGYTAEGKISASGGSAGGELMGAVINQSPELFGAIVAAVPFVDVLNTMLDAKLPLTPGEWPEWGNPIESKAAFTNILSYSPYDQVVAQDYPPMLVTAGLNDPRVTYWEPAKWVAKLREHKTDDNILLLKTNMDAGHGGKSGRFEGLKETAEEVAFILWQLGIEE